MLAALGLVPRWCWELLAVALTAYGLWLAGDFHGAAKVQRKFDAFTATVKAEGEAQEKANAAKVASQQEVVKNVQVTHVTRIAAVHKLPSSLLHTNPGRSITATIPIGPDPRTICFDRAKFDSAIERSFADLQAKLIGIAQSGDVAIVNEVTWGDWYSGVK